MDDELFDGTNDDDDYCYGGNNDDDTDDDMEVTSSLEDFASLVDDICDQR